MLFKTIRWWLISAVLVVPLLVHQEAQGTARIAALSASEQPSLSNGATKAQIKLFLDTQRRTVDYSQIWPSDVPVMFLGEWHTSKSHKEELISNLLDWKENHGLTHVAMEMLRSLEDQKLIDDYFNGIADCKALLLLFQSRWSKGPGIPEKYMELVDAVKGAGLKLLALDLHIAHPLPHLRLEIFRQRNAKWAEVIHRVLDADPKARIVVLNGQIHSGYDKNDDSANEILEHSFGHKSIVVEFAGGHNFETLSYLDHELSVRISLVARLVFLDQKRFCFPIDKSDDVRTADYMVHLPQVDRLPSPTELLIAPRSLPLNEFLRRLRN